MSLHLELSISLHVYHSTTCLNANILSDFPQPEDYFFNLTCPTTPKLTYTHRQLKITYIEGEMNRTESYSLMSLSHLFEHLALHSCVLLGFHLYPLSDLHTQFYTHTNTQTNAHMHMSVGACMHTQTFRSVGMSFLIVCQAATSGDLRLEKKELKLFVRNLSHRTEAIIACCIAMAMVSELAWVGERYTLREESRLRD